MHGRSGMSRGVERALNRTGPSHPDRESDRCRCGAFLLFGTDHLGRVIERCPDCGHNQPISKHLAPKSPPSPHELRRKQQ